MDDPRSVKAALGAEFPDWHFLHTDRCRWWALRGPLPPDRINEVDAVDADTPEELRAQLADVTGPAR